MSAEKQNYNLVPLADLVEAFGYTRDHLAYLCRIGEITGEKQGRGWYSSHDAVEQYRQRVESEAAKRWAEMSEQLKTGPKSIERKVDVILVSTLPKISALRGGLRIAINSVLAPFKLFSLLQTVMVLALNAVLRTIYFVATLPRRAFATAPRVHKFVHLSERDLFDEFGHELSYWRIGRLKQRYTGLYVSGLMLVIGIGFTFSTARLLGVPMSEVDAHFAHYTNPPVERALSAVDQALEPYVEGTLGAYLARRQEQRVAEALIAQLTGSRPLVRDYLYAGMVNAEEEQTVFQTNRAVAGAFAPAEQAPSGRLSHSIQSILHSVDIFSDQLGVYLINSFRQAGDRWGELRSNHDAEPVEQPQPASQPFGFGQIAPGEIEVRIQNSNITLESLVFVTFLDNLAGNGYFVADRSPGQYFVLRLSEPAQGELSFQYWIIDPMSSFELSGR